MVIHCGFIHDFSNFAASVRTDLLATQAMVDALATAGTSAGASGGVGRIFINTSGTAILSDGLGQTEDTAGDPAATIGHRVPAEHATTGAAQRGVRSAVIRLPPSVHGAGDHGFVPILMDIARKTGVSAYVGAGTNRWPAVHRDDAAVLYRLAVEKLADGSVPPGSILHGVADAGVPFREIATLIGEKLKLPVDSRPAEHFGWFGTFAAIDNPMSTEITQRQTGWRPTRPGLLADLRSAAYA